ncbi:MAG: sigma-E processing peptidase SpoIIGA, partial [Lachnospiraceae bacterium]|nr:sigma-E processing peptidase SpoIIGA [Lachnospiraceae bacterium]
LYGVGSFLFGASIKNRIGAGGQGIVPAAVLLALLTVLIAGVILFAARARREAVNTPVYQVRFLIGDGDAPYCCRGFLDTGNGLYEPFGKKPVLLLVSPKYKAVLEEFLAKSPEKTRYIPYRAIGHSDGMLLGAELKELVILRGQEEIHLTGIPAAYTEISGRGDAYQVILHPDFFP